MERKELYKNWLKFTLVVSLIFSVFYFHYYIHYMLPDKIYLTRSKEETISLPFFLPTTLQSDSEEVMVGQTDTLSQEQVHITSQDGFSLYGEKNGTYKLDYRLFGLFSLKEIEVDVSEEKYVIPGGEHVGIYLQTDGIMVIGTASIEKKGGQVCEPAAGILKSGDYILEVSGEPVSSKERLLELVAANQTQPLLLKIERNGEQMECVVNPVEDSEGNYRIGIWVRDDTHGIGTLTYIDENGNFAALGHGISDGDTGLLVASGQGSLYKASIHSIKKGTDGTPGSLSGTIEYEKQSYLGNVTKNCECGLFGQGNEGLQNMLKGQAEPVAVAHAQEVETGDASILCEINGVMGEYEIEIQKINLGGKETKNMVIKVTDQELIKETGGIVQGMSGSPIIQNGKIVGAVTHVFVRDSTMGYGILIENMMDAME